MLGRSTTAIPRAATATEFIEPTQGYDAHQCALLPQEGIPTQAQFDRSQVNRDVIWNSLIIIT